MAFMDGVINCNQSHGGRHAWGEAKAVTSTVTGRTDHKQTCGDCGVSAWGSSRAEANAAAQATDRAHRQGRL
jgi:hypothetical protein